MVFLTNTPLKVPSVSQLRTDTPLKLYVWAAEGVMFYWILYFFWTLTDTFFWGENDYLPADSLALGDNPFFTWMNIFFECIILDIFEWIDSLNE